MLPDNNILDILISLVLIYALLSILVSILLEWWNHKKKARAKFLRKAVHQLLCDPLNVNYGELFYNHYLIEGFRSKELKTVPQYISSQLFAEVLIDVIANRKFHDTPVTMTGQSEDIGKQYELIEATVPESTIERFQSELMSMNPSPFSDTLRSFWQKSGGDFDQMKRQLSFWFDDYMDRVSGWYKTKQRTKLLVFGFVVAIGLNADSLHLLKVLSLDDQLRSRLVATAGRVADNYEAESKQAKDINYLTVVTRSMDSVQLKAMKNKETLIDSLKRKYPLTKELKRLNDSIDAVYMLQADSVMGIMAALDIPIGWKEDAAPISWFREPNADGPPAGKGILSYQYHRNERSVKSIGMYILGIIISGISLSFGAPFWFETLVKLINIRRAGKKPEPVNSKTKE